MYIKLDDYDFDRTAKAVYIMNPSVHDMFDDWQGLRSWMESLAYKMGSDISLSTGGFQLTAFPFGEGRMVRASVSAYTALKYVESMQGISGVLKEIVSQIDQTSDGKLFARDNCIERARQHVAVQ